MVFVWAQVFPSLETLVATPDDHRVMDRAIARDRALAFAENRLGVSPADVAKVDLTHFSDSDAVGYFSKYKLKDEYDQSWDERFPTDVYRADIRLASGGWVQVSLQMETGKLVAWKRIGGAAAGASSNPERDAAGMLAQWGYDLADWEPVGTVATDRATVFQSRKAPIGEAKLQLLVKPGEELGYRIVLPASFLESIHAQERLATRLSMLGYIVPEIVLFVLAVVYAASYGSFTSFKRGRLLAALYFVLYVLFTLNMTAGLRSKSETGLPVSGQSVQSLIVVNAVILGATALLSYFAAVGGDGLWRSMGFSLWPRWREADYGRRVLRSVRQGYALAFIVLGAQSVILIALEKLLGSFTSSDASQSSYNLAYPWLMPLIAWCAGISEELLYRLFGIALFRRWLTGAARLLLRREPSRRTTAALTFAAMIPPSVIWAFGHVGYPIYPVYSRLIELTLLGLLFGWFMLRFGLMAAIFTHVTLDATLVGTQLLFDGLPYDWLSGLFSIAMPALAGGAIWLLHRSSRAAGGRHGSPDRLEPPPA
ncbi:type II CAAX prenyl endopeptidase Rce1 family protein [Cohnella thermotolerans]|uniref:CPBP family glutamic-type intramembrane protease n=1 Tax=Cohnella thermotolerans TaxID=329858 RepID=UPI00047E939E|nr:CPBP family glutamic-type intramembrane protease [Cohnella thermotolerans]